MFVLFVFVVCRVVVWFVVLFCLCFSFAVLLCVMLLGFDWLVIVWCVFVVYVAVFRFVVLFRVGGYGLGWCCFVLWCVVLCVCLLCFRRVFRFVRVVVLLWLRFGVVGIDLGWVLLR